MQNKKPSSYKNTVSIKMKVCFLFFWVISFAVFTQPFKGMMSFQVSLTLALVFMFVAIGALFSLTTSRCPSCNEFFFVYKAKILQFLLRPRLSHKCKNCGYSFIFEK